jgi:hypothetical protein
MHRELLKFLVLSYVHYTILQCYKIPLGKFVGYSNSMGTGTCGILVTADLSPYEADGIMATCSGLQLTSLPNLILTSSGSLKKVDRFIEAGFRFLSFR